MFSYNMRIYDTNNWNCFKEFGLGNKIQDGFWDDDDEKIFFLFDNNRIVV